jgi:hypothetical protein
MVSTFNIKTKEFFSALTLFKRLSRAAKKKDTIIEITVIDGGLTLNIPGAEQTVQAQTRGSAKFAMKLKLLSDIVSTYKTEMLNCILTNSSIQIQNSTIPVTSTFFSDDSILRSINMPINYSYVDLIRLKNSGKYTEQEIEFNQLTIMIEEALFKIKVDINEVFLRLKPYGFTISEVSDLVMSKLNAAE